MPVNPGEIKVSFVRYEEPGLFFGNQLGSESEQDLKTGLNRTLQDNKTEFKIRKILSQKKF
ncbi:TPA: hypothetical protein HA338_00205 [Methanosarcina acetivorans]|nr:hypothetical protein [Methanosarcina acetivorans]HIH92516.1 hypothetical protein [Methanosarcina acetivorans]